MRPRLSPLCLLAALLLGGCVTTPDAPTPAPPTSAPTSPAVTPGTATKTPTARPTPSPTPEPKPLDGMVVVVDPGHNAQYRKSFNTRQVPAGDGRTKACNSSGTAGKGLPEHAYNWAQAGVLVEELEARGATVLLTREDDASLGPCVNQRAAVANDNGADLLISIHADGSHSSGARGFHVIISTTMAGGAELEARSKQLATTARDAIERATDMPRSTYIGKGTALSPRSDIATLNLLESTPGIMLEMGNMRHRKDLALLKSKDFRQQVAKALAEAAVEILTD